MGTHRVWLCDVQDIPDRQARGFDPAGRGQDEFFVVRRGDQLHAWRNECPHIKGAPMAWRRHAYLSSDGEAIVCHAHGARFDIETGRCLAGLPPDHHLTPVPLYFTTPSETPGSPIRMGIDTETKEG